MVGFLWHLHIDTLRQLWEEGLSCSQIAIIIGTTRCAVAGKARRLGLGSRGDREWHRPGGVIVRPKVSKPKLVLVQEPLLPEIEFLVNGERVTLETAASGMCRFLHGEGTEQYCCAHETVNDSSWCAAHYKLCYQPPKAEPEKPKRKLDTAGEKFAGWY